MQILIVILFGILGFVIFLVIMFKRWNTRFAKDSDFESGDLKVKVVRRDSLEMGDPRGFYFVVP